MEFHLRSTGFEMSSMGRPGRTASFWIVAATMGLYLFAAAAPSPLYAVYAGKWHFSAIAITEVFAVYAIALLVALLLTGSLSDFAGRRPVLLAALAFQIAGMLMFLVASGLGWLFAARITQGIATGIATSALAASLVDLQPAGHPTLGSTVNSATPAVGLASGALVAAAIVQYGPDPLRLVYWLLIVAFAIAFLAVLVMAEPATRRAALNLVPRVGIEASARPAFAASVPSLVAGWAVAGFYLSLGPSVALNLAGSNNRILGGLAIGLLAGVGAISIIAARSWPAGRSMTVGEVALLVGLALTVLAIAVTAPGLFFAATAVTGIGFGVAWLGVLRSLVLLASPTARGALLAAIFIVAYMAFAVPAVIAGYLVTRIGLHDAALWYAGAVGVLAIGGFVGTLFVQRSARVEAQA